MKGGEESEGEDQEIKGTREARSSDVLVIVSLMKLGKAVEKLLSL